MATIRMVMSRFWNCRRKIRQGEIFFAGRQDIGAIKAEALLSLRLAQAIGAGPQQFQDLPGAQGVEGLAPCFHSRYFIL